MKLALLIIPLLLFMTSCSIDWNDKKDSKITELEKQIQELKFWNESQEKNLETVIWMQCMYAFIFQSEEFRNCWFDRKCEDVYLQKNDIKLRTWSKAVESCIDTWKERIKLLNN